MEIVPSWLHLACQIGSFFLWNEWVEGGLGCVDGERMECVERLSECNRLILACQQSLNPKILFSRSPSNIGRGSKLDRG